MYKKHREPFKIKVVEPIKWNTREERKKVIEDAHFCDAYIPAEEIPINFSTDSGTTAMSQEQWAGMIQADESYFRCKNWFNLEKSAQDFTGFKYILPTHQGRPAENIICTLLIKKGDTVLANAHFGSTEGLARRLGANPVNLYTEEALHPELSTKFKGNIDIDKLKKTIRKIGSKNISFLNMVLTNNYTAGQPVSMANLREASKIARENGIKVVIDSARVTENAYFIKKKEPGYEDKSIREICQEIFSYADLMHMSAKKGGMVNIGGLIATNDKDMYDAMQDLLLMFEGFVTYGGLAGRDLEALAIGINEGLEYDFLAHRVGQVEYFGKLLRDRGIPIYEPPGGHAIYVDASSKIYPHIPKEEFVAQALVVQTYIESGVMGGANPSSLGYSRTDPKTGKLIPCPFELIRFCIPRRVYTYSQLEYAADGVKAAIDRGKSVKGFRFKWRPKSEYSGIFFYQLERLK